jgi:HK97 gp10 family phage protein
VLAMKVSGVAETVRKIHRIVPVIHNVESDAVRETCEEIRDFARRLAPVLTGELRKSIIYRTQFKKGDAGEMRHVGFIGLRASSPAAVYWRFIEFGTSVYSAHPMFGPAAQAAKTGYIRRMMGMGRRLEGL